MFSFCSVRRKARNIRKFNLQFFFKVSISLEERDCIWNLEIFACYSFWLTTIFFRVYFTHHKIFVTQEIYSKTSQKDTFLSFSHLLKFFNIPQILFCTLCPVLFIDCSYSLVEFNPLYFEWILTANYVFQERIT